MFLADSRKRADDVVCLVTLLFVNWQIERAHQFFHARDLRVQLIRGLDPFRLVGVVEFVSEGRARQIERDRDILRLHFLERPEQKQGKTINAIGRLAFLVREVGDSMKAAMDQRITIN